MLYEVSIAQVLIASERNSGVARGGGGGPPRAARPGGGIFNKLYVNFFLIYFEQPLRMLYRLIVNHLAVVLNALAQSCGNGPVISFTLHCIPASKI